MPENFTAEPTRSAVNALARDVVLSLNPAEVIFFDDVSAAYWESGGVAPRRSGGGMRFGDGADVVKALTPAALAVSSFALGLLADMAKTAATEAAKKAIAAAWPRLQDALRRGERPSEAAKLPLDEELKRKLLSDVAEEARRYLSDVRAEELARRVAGRLIRPSEAGAGS